MFLILLNLLKLIVGIGGMFMLFCVGVLLEVVGVVVDFRKVVMFLCRI